MKIWSLLLIIVFGVSGSAQKQHRGQTIQEILALPEAEIDIGMATLVLAKEFYPDLNISYFLYTFDYLAKRYYHFFGNYQEAEMRIRALNTFLYRPGAWNDSITFSYDDNDLQVTLRKNRFINGYLSSKTGSCITMPMLYLILGERLGFPIYPVRSPKHFFVRYISNEATLNFQDNIETTNGGSFISDAQYQHDVLIPENAIENGVYLRTLSKKEYLATLLSINAAEYMLMDSIAKAKAYLQLAIKYDSTFAGAYWNYGILYLQEAEKLAALMNTEKRTELILAQTSSQKRRELNRENHSSKNLQNKAISQPNFLPVIKPMPDYRHPFRGQNRVNPFQNQPRISLQSQQALQVMMQRIEEKYLPVIRKKMVVYQQYRAKAEAMGYVKTFPIEFFQKQSESIKQFQKNGGY